MSKEKYVAYIRVSTVKQGEKGVSLQEQKDAILRYARRCGFDIVDWFEEKVTAAKRGRPQFARLLRVLKSGKVAGVIIHKIDRSSRNLRDWADLGELIDEGITVHFANEGIDLSSRGGRLSADIQAVVAADFIRNLRDEAKKGFYGRLKQGIYPLAAPIGYLDAGGGKPKVPDPEKAPLVRKVFELYATGRYSFSDLVVEARKIGLINRRGGPILRTRLTDILNNPFYTGIIRLKDGQTFQGIHQPIISAGLYRSVQGVIRGRTNTRTVTHDYLYRRLFRCSHCSKSLIGERQKGTIYYRCQTKTCPTKCVREDSLERAVNRALHPLEFGSDEKRYARCELERFMENWETSSRRAIQVNRQHRDQIDDRLNRLTDAFIDGVIDKDSHNRRKEALLQERRDIDDILDLLHGDGTVIRDSIGEFLELAESARNMYKLAVVPEKREMLEIVTSNRVVDRKNVAITRSDPFERIATRWENMKCPPYRDVPRTASTMTRVWKSVIKDLVALVRGQRADISRS